MEVYGEFSGADLSRSNAVDGELLLEGSDVAAAFLKNSLINGELPRRLPRFNCWTMLDPAQQRSLVAVPKKGPLVSWNVPAAGAAAAVAAVPAVVVALVVVAAWRLDQSCRRD